MPSRATIRHNPDVVIAEVDDEVVLLNLARSTFAHLNETATSVWRCLVEPRNLDQIVTELVAAHDVDGDECQRDVADLVERMAAEGFLLVEETAGSGG